MKMNTSWSAFPVREDGLLGTTFKNLVQDCRGAKVTPATIKTQSEGILYELLRGLGLIPTDEERRERGIHRCYHLVTKKNKVATFY